MELPSPYGRNFRTNLLFEDRHASFAAGLEVRPSARYDAEFRPEVLATSCPGGDLDSLSPLPWGEGGPLPALSRAGAGRVRGLSDPVDLFPVAKRSEIIYGPRKRSEAKSLQGLKLRPSATPPYLTF